MLCCFCFMLILMCCAAVQLLPVCCSGVHLQRSKPLSENMHASRLPGNHVPVSDYHKPGANAHRRKQPTRSKPPRNELKQGRLVFSLQPQFKSKNMVTCVHMLLVCCVVCAKTTQQTRSMCTHVTMFLLLNRGCGENTNLPCFNHHFWVVCSLVAVFRRCAFAPGL